MLAVTWIRRRKVARVTPACLLWSTIPWGCAEEGLWKGTDNFFHHRVVSRRRRRAYTVFGQIDTRPQRGPQKVSKHGSMFRVFFFAAFISTRPSRDIRFYAWAEKEREPLNSCYEGNLARQSWFRIARRRGRRGPRANIDDESGGCSFKFMRPQCEPLLVGIRGSGFSGSRVSCATRCGESILRKVGDSRVGGKDFHVSHNYSWCYENCGWTTVSYVTG